MSSRACVTFSSNYTTKRCALSTGDASNIRPKKSATYDTYVSQVSVALNALHNSRDLYGMYNGHFGSYVSPTPEVNTYMENVKAMTCNVFSYPALDFAVDAPVASCLCRLKHLFPPPDHLRVVSASTRQVKPKQRKYRGISSKRKLGYDSCQT